MRSCWRFLGKLNIRTMWVSFTISRTHNSLSSTSWDQQIDRKTDAGISVGPKKNPVPAVGAVEMGNFFRLWRFYKPEGKLMLVLFWGGVGWSSRFFVGCFFLWKLKQFICTASLEKLWSCKTYFKHEQKNVCLLGWKSGTFLAVVERWQVVARFISEAKAAF